MSQAFDTVNHYTLIEKLINTNTPNLITRFIVNYIRGRKAFTQYKNKNSFKKQFKAGVPQGGVLSPTLFNIYMSDLPTPPRDIHVTTYADDITIYSSDKNYTIAQQRLQPYLEDVQTWTKANDLKLNASKTMTTLFTPDPAEYRDELSLQLDNTRLPTIRNPQILGLTFDPKLTFNEHIKTSKDKAEKTINILKAKTSTHWGKNKETLTNTYKTVTGPILEYAGTIYAPIISDKQLTSLQVTQNQGLRIATGCTSDTNINHIHDETKILPIEKHLRLHSSQLRQKASHPDHPLHRLTTQPQPPRLKKKTIFNNNQYTINIDPDPTHAIYENTIKRNMKTATLVSAFVLSRIDYCNSLLFGSTLDVTSHLQRIQNYAARVILRLPMSSRITIHLKSLHWLPVKVRSTYKIACLCYHCHSSTAPSYVTDMLHKKPLHTRNTRSSSYTMPLLNRPAHSKATLGDRSFSFASSSVWNSIPNDVKCAPSLSSFKSRLKTYLFCSVYKD